MGCLSSGVSPASIPILVPEAPVPAASECWSTSVASTEMIELLSPATIFPRLCGSARLEVGAKEGSLCSIGRAIVATSRSDSLVEDRLSRGPDWAWADVPL